MTIAEQVKAARENAVMWQVELAEASGVDVSAIKRIENNKTNPSVRTLQRIAAALNAEFTIRGDA